MAANGAKQTKDSQLFHSSTLDVRRKESDTGSMRKRKKHRIHPGEILKEEFLAPRGISANHLAVSLGVAANRISGIINGKRAITGETAILFGKAFNTTPEFWISLQAHHDLDLARAQVSIDRIRRAERFAREYGLT
jgi:addiction module HigA family antidote